MKHFCPGYIRHHPGSIAHYMYWIQQEEYMQHFLNGLKTLAGFFLKLEHFLHGSMPWRLEHFCIHLFIWLALLGPTL